MSRVREGPRLLLRPHSGRQNQLSVDTALAKEKAGSVWAPLFSSAGKDYPPERSTLILKTGPALTLVFFFTAAGYGQATRSARFEARPQTTQYDRSAC